MAIQDEDLIMHSKWKSPGQFASGTVNVNVTAVAMGNNTARSFETEVPFDASLFPTAQVYYAASGYPGYWYPAPDTFFTGAPDGMPVQVTSVVTNDRLKIRVTYRNTFGGTVTIAARTFTFKYFLFV